MDVDSSTDGMANDCNIQIFYLVNLLYDLLHKLVAWQHFKLWLMLLHVELN